MLMTTIGFILVTAIFFGGAFWQRAAGANQSGAQFGLAAGIGYFVGMSVLIWLINLIGGAIGFPDYLTIWIALIVWLVATLIFAIRSDAILDSKAPRAAG